MAGSEGISSTGARERGSRAPVPRRRRQGSGSDPAPPTNAAPEATWRTRARRWLSKISSSWGPSPTFRIFLFLGGILATMGFFLYNEYVIEQLRQQERNRAALYANLYGLASSHHLDEDFSEQIWNTVISNPEIDFPIIVTDHRGAVVLVKGAGLPAAGDTSAAAATRLREIIEQMDARHTPVRFFESPLARGLTYFDGANLVLTDLSGRVVTWAGSKLPAAGGATEAAGEEAAALLQALRTEVDPDTVAVAADGSSRLYVDEGRFVVVDASGKAAAWGGSRFPGHRSPAALEEVLLAAGRWPSPPISFRIRTEKFIHFGQSGMIGQISLAPLVPLAVLAIFSLIGYIGFRNIIRSEQRSIWVGMAKETAHQLGTPLSSLAGWLELMRGSRGEVPEEREAILREMQKDTRRLNQIASRFSQIGSVPELRPSDIGSLISETIAYFRGRSPLFGRHVFEVDLDDLPPVPLNAELMGWAFENLFRNAVDAIGGKDGTISVDARLRGPDTVRITVRDNGRGIDADSITRVFEPGFSTRKRGWGLGLAFVKRIVEEYHGGRIQIAHSAAGWGTTFEIELPVRRDGTGSVDETPWRVE